MGWARWPRYSEFGKLAGHVRYVHRTSRRLARNVFHAMVRFGPSLEKKQAVLGRLVDIGAEAFMMTASCVRARMLVQENPNDRTPEELADLFCRQARRRINARFKALFRNDDAAAYKVARGALDGRYDWVEEGIIGLDDLGLGVAAQEITDDSGPDLKEGRDDPRPQEEAEVTT